MISKSEDFTEVLKSISRVGIRYCIVTKEFSRKLLKYMREVLLIDVVDENEIPDGHICTVYLVRYEYKKDYNSFLNI